MNSHDLLFNLYLGIILKAILHTHEYVYVCLSYCHSLFSNFSFFSALCPWFVPLKLLLPEIRVGRFKIWEIFQTFPCYSSFSGKNTFLSSPSIFLVHFHTQFLNGKSLYHMDQIHCGKPISKIIVHCIFNKPQLPGFAKTSTQSLKV